jgi:hypothetical protein
MVTCVAQRSARRWGLNLQNYPVAARGEDTRVFPFNLLELHRVHRSEIDLLNDSTSLCLLGLIHHTQTSSSRVLAQDSGLSALELQRKLTPLLTSRMLVENSGVLQVTSLGRQVLSELDLPVSPPPLERSVRPIVAARRAVRSRSLAPGAAASFLVLAVVAIVLWVNNVQSQLPLELTPVRTNTPSPTATATVLPVQTPTIRR